MIDYLKDAIEFTRDYSHELTALASCVGGIWVSRYLKTATKSLSRKNRKVLNTLGSGLASFAVAVVLYTGPEPLRVAAALALFNPIIYSVVMLFVEYKATEKGGFWVKVLAWAKPHRVESPAEVRLKNGSKKK